MNDSTMPALAPGDTVTVRDARGVPVQGTVRSCDGGTFVLSLHGAAPSGPVVWLRALDADGDAWEAACEPRDDGADRSLRLSRLGGWRNVEGRLAQRIDAEGGLTAYMDVGSAPPGKRFDLTLNDLSATGCAADGVGRPLELGDLLRLDVGDGSAPLVASVVRLQRFAFGRWRVGVRFDLATPYDRERVLAWRDAWVRQQAA